MKKQLWLDLELRKDIDDFITLLFALDNEEAEIKYVSIDSPSIEEIHLLANTLRKHKSNVKIVITGNITQYEDGNIHDSLLELAKKKEFDKFNKNEIIPLKEAIELASNEELQSLTYFTGGSLLTLAEIIKKEPNIKAFIQGGYAGNNIVPEEIALKKFKKRDTVPSWNLNLNLDATLSVINNKEADLHFISKNVCHASMISSEDTQNYSGQNIDILSKYFADDYNKKFKAKAMHDVLAFMTIFDNEENIVQFKKVDLLSIPASENGFSKWKSVINEDSNLSISVSFNYELFKKNFFNGLTIKKPKIQKKKKSVIKQA